MLTYPIMLDVRNRPAVVVGAGAVGRRKARELASAGARVTLVDPGIFARDDPKLRGVRLARETYAAPCLDGAFLVFACTDDRELNERIAADARAAGALVNAADQPDNCDFFAPAVLRDGHVVVAIGTGGGSPALAGMLKHRLNAALPENAGRFAELLGKLKTEIKADVADARRRGDIFRKLVCDETLRAFDADGERAVRQRLRKILDDAEAGPCPQSK